MPKSRIHDELLSIADYENAAKRKLSEKDINYIYRGAETEATLRRNVDAFSKFLLRRRVLQGIDKVATDTSYFNGRIESDLPFFPGCINVSPLHNGALLDILKGANTFRTPIFISDFSIVAPLEISKLPHLVPKSSPLIWQMYMLTSNYDLCFKRAKQASEWGYAALAVTVDAEANIRLGTETPKALSSRKFHNVSAKDLKKIRSCTDLPFIVKGVMTAEDAEIAIENGADGIVVSNHGGRTLDYGQSTLEVLPEVVAALKSKKKTRNAEIFMDGGIRKGTDILKALALGSRGCLIGRPLFYGLVCGREKGVYEVMKILRDELVRAAALCGVSDLARIPHDIVVSA
ncbi:MAG: alpha-hydroxy-acid oxidizing protein [Nitrososphaerota archaeon]|nr:alpha-hydroxy-acid oxidizing protein [Nitrososphaerota archaeon]